MIKIKTKEEIDGIRLSCQLLAQIFDKLCMQVKIGVTPHQLNALAEQYIQEANAIPSFSNYADFPTALCASVNDAVIHGVPSNIPLKDGDIISLDLGLVKNGYFSDMARTIPIGKVDEKILNLIADTTKSLNLGISAAKNGARISDISKAISKYLQPKGYGIVREYAGHGVGLQVHEDPLIPNDYPGYSHHYNVRLKPGMVIAIEPMVNLGSAQVFVDKKDNWTVRTKDGLPSAHVEHTIAIFEDYIEILTLPST
jgi:methionyl aminopeptidase